MTALANIQFKTNNSFKTLGIASIVAGFALMILVSTMGNRGTATLQGMPFFLIIIGGLNIWRSSTVVLKMFDTHFEFKPAPIAGLKIIKFDDIEKIVEDGKKIFIHLKSQNKAIKLHHSMFVKAEVPDVIQRLKTITATNNSSQPELSQGSEA